MWSCPGTHSRVTGISPLQHPSDEKSYHLSHLDSNDFRGRASLDFIDKTAVEEQISMPQDVVEIRHAGYSIYSVLLRHRWYILGRAVIVAGIFTILAIVSPPNYESVAQLMPPDDTSSMAGDAGERAASLIGLPPDLLGGSGKGALFSKILTSQSVEDAVIARF